MQRVQHTAPQYCGHDHVHNAHTQVDPVLSAVTTTPPPPPLSLLMGLQSVRCISQGFSTCHPQIINTLIVGAASKNSTACSSAICQTLLQVGH